MKSRRALAVISMISLGALAILCLQTLNRLQQSVIVPVICVAMIFAFAMALGGSRSGARGPTESRAPDYAIVAAKADEIEQEMKRVGLWQEKPLAPEQYKFASAFAMDTMSYDQWLQFVFLPRVREIISTRGKFPTSSSVGVQAVREFDTDPNGQRLITLLSEFDRLV